MLYYNYILKEDLDGQDGHTHFLVALEKRRTKSPKHRQEFITPKHAVTNIHQQSCIQTHIFRFAYVL